MKNIGIVFNLDVLEHGFNALKLFMQLTNPKQLRNCSICDGDLLRPSNEIVKSRYDYCVAVSGFSVDKLYIKSIFQDSDIPELAPNHRRVYEDLPLDRLAISESGFIDSLGRFVTQEWERTYHDLCKKVGWGYDPSILNYELDEKLKHELEALRKI